MQPQTAYWILSTIAQASAALAGLTALLLVFIVREVKREFRVPMDVALGYVLSAIPLYRSLAVGTVAYLVAAVGSVATLWWVTPGSAPVGVWVQLLVVFWIGLMGAGSLGLVLFVFLPRRWVDEPKVTEARKEWIDRQNRPRQ